MIDWIDTVVHQPWFRALDFAFHIVVFWHVVAHVCRAGMRLHRWVHRPLLRALQSVAPVTYLRLRRYMLDKQFAAENAWDRKEHA